MLSDDERRILHAMDQIVSKAHKRGCHIVRFMVQENIWLRLLKNIEKNFESDIAMVGPKSYRGVFVEFHNSDASKIYFKDAPDISSSC